MLKKTTLSCILLKQNKFDVLKFSKNAYFYKGLSFLEQNTIGLNNCLFGLKREHRIRVSYKFVCLVRGTYGKNLGMLPVGRHAFLKEHTFNKFVIFKKKSW
jgi:hypothetical protein